MDIKRYNWPNCPCHWEAIIKLWAGVTDSQINATLEELPSLTQPVNYYFKFDEFWCNCCSSVLYFSFITTSIYCLLLIRKCCHFSACKLNVLLVSWPGLLGERHPQIWWVAFAKKRDRIIKPSTSLNRVALFQEEQKRGGNCARIRS